MRNRMRNGRYRVDLPGHMAECDANYLRLMKLFPRLREEHGTVFGMALGHQQSRVRVEVIERGPYTTLLELRQWPEVQWANAPHMRVRLYHDARSAEVVEFQGARHFRPRYAYPNRLMHQPDEKAQVNRFLSEFLSLCLAQGIAVTELASTD